jgi:hypothetical protein
VEYIGDEMWVIQQFSGVWRISRRRTRRKSLNRLSSCSSPVYSTLKPLCHRAVNAGNGCEGGVCRRSCLFSDFLPFRSREHRQTKIAETVTSRRLYTPPLDPSAIVKSMEEESKDGVYMGDDMPRLFNNKHSRVSCRSNMPPKGCFLGTKPPTKGGSVRFW